MNIKKLKLGLLPTVAAAGIAASALYWGVVAQDRYVSEARVSIRSLSSEDTPSLMKAMIGVGGAPRADELLVRERLRSLEEAQSADKDLALRAAWSRGGVDLPWTLARDASREDFLEMWRKMVTIEVEEPAGTLVIQAQGFTPELAQKLASRLVERADKFSNQAFNRLAQEQLSFVNEEQGKVEARLSKVREELTRFQRDNAVYDLDADAREKAVLVAKLETSLAEAQAELSQARSTMTEDAGQVVVLKGKVNALQGQVASQKAQLGSSRKWETAMEWARLRREVEFLEAEWRTVQAASEKTRAESLRKVKSLIVLEPAQLPEEAVKPSRLQGFFLWSLLSLLGTGCLWLIRGLVKEQSWRY